VEKHAKCDVGTSAKLRTLIIVSGDSMVNQTSLQQESTSFDQINIRQAYISDLLNDVSDRHDQAISKHDHGEKRLVPD
jgi:hypothetical protein